MSRVTENVKTAEVGVETTQETAQKSNEEIDPNRQPVGLVVGLDVGLVSRFFCEGKQSASKMPQVVTKCARSQRWYGKWYGKWYERCHRW